MKKIIIMALSFMTGCASMGADGKVCKVGEVITRPDRCGSNYQRKEWAKVGGLMGKPNRQAVAIANYLTAMDPAGGSWTPLLIPDPKDPRKVACEFVRMQISTPADEAGR